MNEDQTYVEIRNFLIHKFNLNNNIKLSVYPEHEEVAGVTAPDLILDDGYRRFFVEIAPKSSLTKLSYLSLYRDLLKAENRYRETDQFILLFKTIPLRVEELAWKVGIMPVRAPLELKLPGVEPSNPSHKVVMTTARSWKVIYYLLKHGPASIRQVSKSTGVSYGWAHAVVTGLADQGLAVKEYDSARLTDQAKLFNGLAWERPLEALKIDEVEVDYPRSHTAAQEISRNLREYGVNCAFNSFTAGSLYTGRVIRHDTAYMYLKKADLGRFRDLFSDRTHGGLKVKIYAPDRDVFSSSRELESVRITSPEQTLLDLAGAGYGSMELTKAMVEYNEAQ